MTFQRVVNRNFTVGFPGEIVREGPTRGTTGRFDASTNPSSPRNGGNRVGRVFGYKGELPVSGSTQAALVPTFEVGGAVGAYAGIFAHPKHHVLQGTVSGGPLAPSLVVPDGTEGEVLNMVTGLVVEIFNHTKATLNIKAGDTLAYVTTATTDVQDDLILPYGAIIAVPRGAAVPAGFQAISGTVLNPISLAASAVGAVVAGLTIIQTTL
jgi:hypothetical protein